LFDDAEAHAAAAVDGNAGRFVDDQKRIVFVNDVNTLFGFHFQRIGSYIHTF